ncbi:hypothetical protein OY671_008684 [Metschnikowia pulcherrima]|nr:hypothetical protein OY671_008684 [Metschnikowia pulcherrima]
MATANASSSAKSDRNGSNPDGSPANGAPPRGRRRWRSVSPVVASSVAVFAYCWPALHGYAITGASYGARVGCSCRYVGGRTLSDCRKDFEAGMEMITSSEDPQARSVTARFPSSVRQTATYREGSGCVLQPWND